jgi:hypothetical protein
MKTMDGMRPSRLLGLAGVLTVGAGLVHAAAAGTHSADATLVRLFAFTALVQVVVGMLVLSRPGRGGATLAAVVNGAPMAAWVMSRTVGIPFVHSLAGREGVGLADLSVTAMELVALALAAASLRARPLTRSIAFSPLWALALVPTLIGMTAPHTHGAGHDEGHAAGHAHGAEGDRADGSHGHRAEATVALATDPIFAGAETSHSTEEELRLAADLILRTRESVRNRFPTEDAVVAAGYTSIGDGFLFSSFEHFVHSGYMNDGFELDPDRIESIVVESTPTGKWVASAMYILEPGRTMHDVPDLAGELTTWHDHQNICWDESGTRIAGFLRDGRCDPQGRFRVTPPMLHVWMRDHQCGPFAGIEGHGASTCSHSH